MLIAVLLSFAVATVLTAIFSHYAHAWFSPPDAPNQRSLHTRPTLQIGGIAILIAMLLSILLLDIDDDLSGIWLGVGLIALVSFVDDCYPLSARYRLLIHIFAAFICLYLADLWLPALQLPHIVWHWPPLIGQIFSLLFVVWMLNLYNFMDGMDGFAGGMTLFGFASLSYLGYQVDAFLYAQINAVIAAASVGFLLFNFPPSRIFMGDVGASSLGFLAAVLSLWGVQQAILPLWAAVLLFSPFIVDASITLLKRFYRQEKIWEAHRSHHYQRLVCCGWSHKKTVLWSYVLMLSCSFSTLYLLNLSAWQQWLGLGIWILVYSLIIWRVAMLERRHLNLSNITS